MWILNDWSYINSLQITKSTGKKQSDCKYGCVFFEFVMLYETLHYLADRTNEDDQNEKNVKQWYCWWKKSCTTQHARNLVNNWILPYQLVQDSSINSMISNYPIYGYHVWPAVFFAVCPIDIPEHHIGGLWLAGFPFFQGCILRFQPLVFSGILKLNKLSCCFFLWHAIFVNEVEKLKMFTDKLCHMTRTTCLCGYNPGDSMWPFRFPIWR